MEAKEFKEALERAIEKYVSNEEEYGDNAVIEIDPESKAVTLQVEERDEDKYDYYSVMDFIEMDIDNPGKWKLDSAAIDEVADEYSE